MRIITLTKRDLEVPICQLVRGDRLTECVRLNINRYDGAVDLAPLGWAVKIANAAGDTDIVMFDPIIGDMWITYDWILPAIVAASVGTTTFEVEAVDADGGKVWQSGKRTISVIADLDATPGYDPDELSIFQETVSIVGDKVRSMSDQVDGYERRISDAVKSANDTAEELIHKAESGEFNGKDGRDGKDGVNGKDGAPGANGKDGKDGEDGKDGVNGQDGKDWIPTPAELNSIAQNAADKLQPSVTELKRDLADKLTKPDNPVVGKILKIKSVNDDGSIVCEWADDEKGIQLSDIPIIDDQGTAGIVRNVNSADTGLVVGAISGASGYLKINYASESRIAARTGRFPITPLNLNPAVKATLTDSNKMVLTDTEKAAACQTIGAAQDDRWVLIDEIELQNVSAFDKSTEPNGNPYNFKKIELQFAVPENATTSGYCNTACYLSDGQIIRNQLGKLTGKTQRLYAKLWTNRDGNRIDLLRGSFYSRSDNPAINTFYGDTMMDGGSSYGSATYSDGNITRIETAEVLPAGMKIKIYAVRA